MNYSKTVVTRPIRFDSEYQMQIGTAGDTLYISVDPEIPKTLHTLPPDSADLTPKPSVMIQEEFKQIASVNVQGDDLVFSVLLSEANTQDITVSCEVDNSFTTLDTSIRKDNTVNGEPEDILHHEWFKPLPTTLISSTSVDVVIPAGQIKQEVRIPTSVNTEIFKGKGSYYVSKVTIPAIDTVDYMIHHNKQSAYVIQEDSFSYPKWGDCRVQVWGKMIGVSYFEPITDSDTGSIITYQFGYSENTDGSLGRTRLRTKIIDDTPLEELLFIPVENDVPKDVENDVPLDLSTNLPYYKIKVNAGFRM